MKYTLVMILWATHNPLGMGVQFTPVTTQVVTSSRSECEAAGKRFLAAKDDRREAYCIETPETQP